MTSPFLSAAHRMHRQQDSELASLMEGDKAVVRFIGPRRTGKTDSVTTYVRQAKAPCLMVTIKPIPADKRPADVLLAILERELETLATTQPKLFAAYEKVASASEKKTTKRKLGASLKTGPFSATASSEETQKPARHQDDPDITVTAILRRLELASVKLRLRPVVFFDEVQELLLHDSEAGLATLWAIRNEIQHHTASRYVFAGSNQRLFAKLHEGRKAPFLNFGSEIKVAPLLPTEVDAWALPLFQKGGRHVRTLAPATELLCGKIGEVVEVLGYLWRKTEPGALIDEGLQRNAVVEVARTKETLDHVIRRLTPNQAAVLRWVLEHPLESPFGKAATEALRLNAGSVNSALKTLVEGELVEAFGSGSFTVSTPLQIRASLTP